MDSQWLKTQFDLNPEKTKSSLARALGLEPPAISKILKGTRQIKAAEYILMRDYFGLPNDGLGKLQANSNSYVIKPLQLDGMKDPDAVQNEWIIPATVLGRRTQAPPEQIKIFQVEETSMEPAFKRSEQILVDLSDKKPSPPGIFVVSDGFGYLIRQCEMVSKSNPPSVKLSTNDSHFQPQILKLTEFEIIGRVIAKLQWL